MDARTNPMGKRPLCCSRTKEASSQLSAYSAGVELNSLLLVKRPPREASRRGTTSMPSLIDASFSCLQCSSVVSMLLTGTTTSTFGDICHQVSENTGEFARSKKKIAMTAKRGRNAATLTIICTSNGEIDWKGLEYTIYTQKKENGPGRLENARKTLFTKKRICSWQ